MTTTSLFRVISRAVLFTPLCAGFAAGCSSSQGVGNLLAGQACDAFTVDADPQCVCCSKHSGNCQAGVSPCAPAGAAPTCGDPCPDGLSCIKIDGRDVCGVKAECTGLSQQSCGNCGVQTRTCDSGTWSSWSECRNQGPCAPTTTQSCSSGGTQTCGADCQWGACVSECSPGQTQTLSCGLCGTETQTCTGDGTWGAPSACVGQGACSPGSVSACANGTQSCGTDCQWGACLECQQGQTETTSCGQCMTQTRSCSGGTWSGWSECQNTGACTPGAVQACTGGSQTCGSDCQWGSCIAFQCQPGDQTSSACGLCGTQTTTCQSDGTWGAPGECLNQGVCEPYASQSCGTNGVQTCTTACQWDTCATAECTSGQVDTVACGLCGYQSRSCVNGRWTQYGACSGEGECTPGEKGSCGTGGSFTCDSACHWGACTGQTCTGPYVQSCGVCGIQTRTCNNGTWSSFSACIGERDCIPGSTQPCGDGGTQSCNFQCYWDACQ